MGSDVGQGRLHDGSGLWNAEAPEGRAGGDVGLAQMGGRSQVLDAVGQVRVHHRLLRHLT